MDRIEEKNKVHYDKIYSNYSISNILYWLDNLDVFLDNSISTETGWFGLYQGEFRSRLKGKKVLEMGCGNCVNAAVMAGLGAEVYANDIAEVSGEIISKINANYQFTYPIKFIPGDFLNNELKSDSFDFVIGKAFLHHLSIPLEKRFLNEAARLLKKNGEARFFEPAVNNKILDEIRWIIPVKGRPSKLNTKAFRMWKENDPHPDRSFSSKHFERAGHEFFKEVRIIPMGTLERFSRFFPWGPKANAYKKWALEFEKYIPESLNRSLARSQLIIYKSPDK